MATVTVLLDDVDETELVLEGSVTHTLNGKATASVKVPSSLVRTPSGTRQTTVDEDSELWVYVDDELDFRGTVEHLDDQGDEDAIYTVATASDPGYMFEWRPARDGDGDFSKPSFLTDFTTGPQIVEEIVQNSIAWDDDLGIDAFSGTFATGGVNLSGVPTDWPMTLAEVIGLLVSTGELDVILTPTEDPPYLVVLNCFNGNYGSDLSASVEFQYAMGSSSNCRGCRRTRDKSELMNALWIYGGPRVGTSRDPKGDQHWRWNITGDDPGLPVSPYRDELIADSRTRFRRRMQVRILDADSGPSRELYRRWWHQESLLRATPKTLVHLTPHRGIAPAFGIGDLIRVTAGPSFRGGFSGVQRVHQYTYRWDADGVIELGEPVGQSLPAVVVSADGEAA